MSISPPPPWLVRFSQVLLPIIVAVHGFVAIYGLLLQSLYSSGLFSTSQNIDQRLTEHLSETVTFASKFSYGFSIIGSIYLLDWYRWNPWDIPYSLRRCLSLATLKSIGIWAFTISFDRTLFYRNSLVVIIHDALLNREKQMDIFPGALERVRFMCHAMNVATTLEAFLIATGIFIVLCFAFNYFVLHSEYESVTDREDVVRALGVHSVRRSERRFEVAALSVRARHGDKSAIERLQKEDDFDRAVS